LTYKILVNSKDVELDELSSVVLKFLICDFCLPNYIKNKISKNFPHFWKFLTEIWCEYSLIQDGLAHQISNSYLKKSAWCVDTGRTAHLKKKPERIVIKRILLRRLRTFEQRTAWQRSSCLRRRPSWRYTQQKTLGKAGGAAQKVTRCAQYSVSPCSLVSARNPPPPTVSVIDTSERLLLQ
jgi:hypothetical protein